MPQFHNYITALLLALFILPASAESIFENNQIKIRINERTPQQMAAFYEARGFPMPMLHEINKACFFTVGIKNKTNDILWHNLQQWQFFADGQQVSRYDRIYWKTLWMQLKVPMGSQSTFRWTLLPEHLDFRPQESEGGNITLPRGPLNYSIHARFQTGKDKNGPDIDIVLNDIHCGVDNQ